MPKSEDFAFSALNFKLRKVRPPLETTAVRSFLIARSTRFAIPAHYTNPTLLCSCQIRSLLLLSASFHAETTHPGHAGRPGLRQGTRQLPNPAPASRPSDQRLSSHHPRLHLPHLQRQTKRKEPHPEELVSRCLNNTKIFGAEEEKRASQALS